MCCFPTRDEATVKIIDIIQAHPEHDIVVGLRSLGKETLLFKIAKTLKEWISVPSKFYESLQLLNAPNVFQNNDPDCRIRVEPFHKISNKFIEKLNEKIKTIAILPTSLYCGINARPFDNNDNVFIVPYSDHSSYTELMQFVSFLKPCKILPVVSGSARGPFGLSVSDRANMSRFDKYLNVTTTTATQQIPDTVMRFMKGRAFVPLENIKQGAKRKKRLMSASTGMKKVKKGVEYEDSPEKSAEWHTSPLTSNNDPSGNILDKENVVDLTSTDVGETSETQHDQNQGQTQPESKNERMNIDNGSDSGSELELPESQGFEYNSDNEEISYLPKNKEALDFNRKTKVDLEIQEEEIRLNKLKEITNMRKAVPSDLNYKEQEVESLKSSPVSSVQETDKNLATAKRKMLVKRSLEFVLLGRKKLATKSEPCKKSYEDTECHVSEDKLSENEPKFGINDDLDDDLVNDDRGGGDVDDDADYDDNTSNYNSVISTLEEETDGKSEIDESDLMTDDCESQSVLCKQTDKKRESRDIELAEESDKGSKLKKTCSEQLDLNNMGSEDASNYVSAEDSLIVLDGLSQGSNYSVVVINSDSEQTLPTNSQTTELSSSVPEIVAELFNDSQTTELSGRVPESVVELFSDIDGSLPESQTEQSTEKQTVGYDQSRNEITDNKSETKNTGNLENVNSKAALENLSVIKWEPNFARIRKQKFHQMLTRFADGIKM